MPKEAFYAHSTERVDKSDWQTLRSHLEAVAARAQGHASVFGAGSVARLAGLLHDLGKYTQAFQLRLSGEHPKLDHATWGARVARREYGWLGQVAAYGIAGHHSGLADGRALQERLDNPPKHDLVPVWEQEIRLPSLAEIGSLDQFKPCKERSWFQLSLLGRMVFSSLVDADYLDTETFYEGHGRDHSSPELRQLRERLESRLAGFKADTEVNRWRAEILAHVRHQASQAPGLFSLTVPTGGGKTLASLAFALDHAIRHGLRRVIYVIPFTSVVEQNAAVFRDALGDLGEAAVLEHHSAFVEDTTLALDARDKLHLAMENWGCADCRHDGGAVFREPVCGPALTLPKTSQHRGKRHHPGRSTDAAAETSAALHDSAR